MCQGFLIEFPLSNSITSFLTNVSSRPLTQQTWRIRHCKTGQRISLGLSRKEGDGSRDSMESSSYLPWLGANAERSIFGFFVDKEENGDDLNLWHLGYNV